MIRVGLIEDNLSYLKAVQALISTQPDMLLAYTSENLNDIDSLINAAPEVIILDIDLPGVNGIRGVSLIKEKLKNAGVFMLTVFEDDDKIFNSIKAGADGYLLKKDPTDKILEAIRAIYRGESMVNGKIARKVLDYFILKEKKNLVEFEQYKLTKREIEILQMIISGKSYKLIADICCISLHTLFSHTKNIYNKLNIHSRAEIAARFL